MTGKMAKDSQKEILDLVRRLGVLRPRDLELREIPREYLIRLHRQGRLERRGRGLYVLPGHALTANHDLAQVCKRVPRGVVCLLSALRFHGLTTQGPPEVWLALPEKARRPRLDSPPLRIARFSGRALTAGVEHHVIEGVRVPIYSPAKTVADCFKYRNKIGLDVAIEALKDYLAKHRGQVGELWRFAQICRVARVIQPYLEAAR